MSRGKKPGGPRIRMAAPRIVTVSGFTTPPHKPTSAAYGDAAYRERQRFLNTSQWRAISEAKRGIDPLCQRHKLLGEIVAATDCDHWVPMAQLPRARWTEFGNLRSLCKACHTEKTQAELRGEPPPFECAPCTPHPLYS